MNKFIMIILVATAVVNAFSPKFNLIEDYHLNTKCVERGDFCHSDDECCSELICYQGVVGADKCLLDENNCLESGNDCYAREECCSGHCFMIPGVGNKCG